MKFYIGNTDSEWFEFHREEQPESVNFWRPQGSRNFKVLQPGQPFLFRRKSPIKKIGGVAFFAGFEALPLSVAWSYFGKENGASTFEGFRDKIYEIRSKASRVAFEHDPTIGCIILNNPIFFSDQDFIELPFHFPGSIVQGKGMETDSGDGKLLWDLVKKQIDNRPILQEPMYGSLAPLREPNTYEKPVTIKIRQGQAAFRINVLRAYGRRCALTGETAISVLEAAHLREFASQGPHRVENGMLLRVDIHRLYDAGYFTFDEGWRVIQSPRLATDFPQSNYCELLQDKEIRLPNRKSHSPNASYVAWHRENRFLKE